MMPAQSRSRACLLGVFVVLGSLPVSSATHACPTSHSGPRDALLKPEAWAKIVAEHQPKFAEGHRAPAQVSAAIQRPPTLPAIGAGAAPGIQPWGGADPARWTAEAVLANAVSGAMNSAWHRMPSSLSTVDPLVDAVIAVPLRMLGSNYRPYGDGQSNASLSFGPGWNEKRPQLTALLRRFRSGKMEVVFRFDRKLALAVGSKVEGRYSSATGENRIELVLTRDADQDSFGTWRVPPDLDWKQSTQSQVLRIRPVGWQDWFPVSFRHPVMKARDLVLQVPPNARRFGNGRFVIDPDFVSAQVRPDWRPANAARPADLPSTPSAAGLNAYDQLMMKSRPAGFTPGYNAQPYQVTNIHGLYPTELGAPTAVGSGRTWLIEQPHTPFKILYTCFQGRGSRPWSGVDPVGRPGNLQEEARLGVPTGGGWHEIGRAPQGAGPNFGETVINSLENEPILMGFAVQQPGPTPTGVEKYAFGLTDVATVRWLFPGEAMVTMIGDSPWGYLRGKPPEVKHNFHWFLFQQDREVCTEEWVHPCEPTAADPLGFACLARAT